jgi:SH3-like domain-containing protein
VQMCSKRRMAGQATALLALILSGCGDKAGPAGRPTPSGLPVPRYVSLKFGEVNARQGPGEDHKILWVYRAKGLPVQVVAETREWRKVCDPDGQTAWVRSRVTDGRRSVMRVGGERLALHAAPKAEARITAYMAPRSIAAMEKCKDGWCRIKGENAKGWALRTEVWGTAEGSQCPPPGGEAGR